jgi:hypothetical protein
MLFPLIKHPHLSTRISAHPGRPWSIFREVIAIYFLAAITGGAGIQPILVAFRIGASQGGEESQRMNGERAGWSI